MPSGKLCSLVPCVACLCHVACPKRPPPPIDSGAAERELDSAVVSVLACNSASVWSSDRCRDVVELLQEMKELAPAHLVPEMRRHAVWLKQLESMCREKEGQSLWKHKQHSTPACSSKQLRRLVKCVLLTGMLQSAKSLSLALRLAVSVSLPAALAEEVCTEIAATPKKLPSQATMYRHRSTVAFAAVLLEREVHKEMLTTGGGIVRWAMADASPQGIHDYLLITYSVVAVKDLDEAFADAQFLATSCLSDSDDSAVQQQRTQALSRLQKLAFKAAPPSAIGSGRAGISHKLHAYVQAVRLQAMDWADTASILSATVSLTSDLGTEAAMSTVSPFSLSELFPWSADEGDSEADLEYVPMQASRLGSSSSMNIGAGSPEGFAYQPFQHQQQQPEDDDDEDFAYSSVANASMSLGKAPLASSSVPSSSLQSSNTCSPCSRLNILDPSTVPLFFFE